MKEASRIGSIAAIASLVVRLTATGMANDALLSCLAPAHDAFVGVHDHTA